MIRWMCGVKLSDRKVNVELLSRLGMERVSDVVRRGSLRWFRHVERKEPDDWSACRHIVGRGCGRRMHRKTWRECIDEDIKLKLSVM